jgi:hypothetical protein
MSSNLVFPATKAEFLRYFETVQAVGWNKILVMKQEVKIVVLLHILPEWLVFVHISNQGIP